MKLNILNLNLFFFIFSAIFLCNAVELDKTGLAATWGVLVGLHCETWLNKLVLSIPKV